MTIPLDQITNMPAFSPYYPPLPARYRNVRFHMVCFRADKSRWTGSSPGVSSRTRTATVPPSASTRPGRPTTGGFWRVCSPSSAATRDSRVTLRHRFPHSKSSIPAGREIYGTPKVYSDIRVGWMSGSCIRTLDWRALRSWRSGPPCTAHGPGEPARFYAVLALEGDPQGGRQGVRRPPGHRRRQCTSDVTVHVCRAATALSSSIPHPSTT